MLRINQPDIGIIEDYRLKGAKVATDKRELKIVKRQVKRETDPATGQVRIVPGPKVVSKKVMRYYRYRELPNGERGDIKEVPYEEAKKFIRYKDPQGGGEEFKVTVKYEERLFVSDEQGNALFDREVPQSEVLEYQEIEEEGKTSGEEVSPFDRTEVVEVEGYVPLERIQEYLFKSIYQLKPNTEKKVGETSERVVKFSRFLLDKQVALLAFFSFGRGYEFYTALVFPYERRKDGRLWLLIGMAEGILLPDSTWALQAEEKQTVTAPVPMVAKKKPKVRISS
ncbi:MAG: hypothetical protein M1587_01340 [Thaumarchaeota archaeon]|nr:hypothetical protein [Nitrososphaerota archaeon]